MTGLRIAPVGAALLVSLAAFAAAEDSPPAETKAMAPQESATADTDKAPGTDRDCDQGISMTPEELIASMNAGNGC